tara:strand:- start:483 stop:779 length:297 start_codon:yes stop_codon:yes gene_type:complete
MQESVFPQDNTGFKDIFIPASDQVNILITKLNEFAERAGQDASQASREIFITDFTQEDPDNLDLSTELNQFVERTEQDASQASREIFITDIAQEDSEI